MVWRANIRKMFLLHAGWLCYVRLRVEPREQRVHIFHEMMEILSAAASDRERLKSCNLHKRPKAEAHSHGSEPKLIEVAQSHWRQFAHAARGRRVGFRNECDARNLMGHRTLSVEGFLRGAGGSKPFAT